MKDNKRKKLVDAVATSMCRQENRLSTKRLKIEMRNQYPNETWNKYHDGKNKGVSDYFHELVQEGKYVSIADNGTYQTYACKAYPIISKKGDSYIADQEESILPTSAMQKLVKAISRARLSTASQIFAQTYAGVKPPPQPAPTKKTAQATKPMATNVTVSVKSANAKTQPRLANGKFASRSLPVAAAKAKANPTKANVTAAFAAMGNKTHNVKSVSKLTALKMIQDYKGKMKIATFVKQDGSERKMRFDLLDLNPTPLGYLRVIDLHVAATKDPKDDGMRNINMQTLKSIKLGRKFCNVK